MYPPTCRRETPATDRPPPVRVLLAICTLTWLAGCDGGASLAGVRVESLRFGAAAEGKRLFEEPLPHTNGRACATCHVLDEATTLRPESVVKRLEENPSDPLFHALDADDPSAPELTFEHLKKGLVRVVLPLPDNMDVIDAAGDLITPADRTIFVWRGVPSVANAAISGPYQSDGREPTLQRQAQSAVFAHSQGTALSRLELDRIAAFERSLFSSVRAWWVSELIEHGMPEEHVPVPEDYLALSPREERGRQVYESACAACHGGARTDRITDRAVSGALFPALTPEGNLRFEAAPGEPPKPVRIERPGVDFMNAGFQNITYFGQLGLAPAFKRRSAGVPRAPLKGERS